MWNVFAAEKISLSLAGDVRTPAFLGAAVAQGNAIGRTI